MLDFSNKGKGTELQLFPQNFVLTQDSVNTNVPEKVICSKNIDLNSLNITIPIYVTGNEGEAFQNVT